jgi:lipoprotein signal peptidase
MKKTGRSFSLAQNQNWLLVVVFFLIVIFSIRFGILLQKSKEDL